MPRMRLRGDEQRLTRVVKGLHASVFVCAATYFGGLLDRVTWFTFPGDAPPVCGGNKKPHQPGGLTGWFGLGVETLLLSGFRVSAFRGMCNLMVVDWLNPFRSVGRSLESAGQDHVGQHRSGDKSPCDRPENVGDDECRPREVLHAVPPFVRSVVSASVLNSIPSSRPRDFNPSSPTHVAVHPSARHIAVTS